VAKFQETGCRAALDGIAGDMRLAPETDTITI
jgi:hypothetical protein